MSTESDQFNSDSAREILAMKGNNTSMGELVAKGVGTAVTASILIQSGKGIMSTLAKHPIGMFGLGIVSGYLTHKYRKEIILLGNQTAVQSKDFVLRQKEHLKDLIAETSEDADEKGASQ